MPYHLQVAITEQAKADPTAPIPWPQESVSLADGQLANNKEDVNRLFQHFRAQGYEGDHRHGFRGSVSRRNSRSQLGQAQA